MSLFSPQLDDRTFDQLVEAAKQRAKQSCPGWTDFSPNDPGMVLLELFAFLTETMIYRLNRLPDKAFVEFLRLMGVKLQPPSAARVKLRFRRTENVADGSAPTAVGIPIPLGTIVTSDVAHSSGITPEFVTLAAAEIGGDRDHVDVLALHFEQINAELVGFATGQPGQSIVVSQGPILAPVGDDLDLVVAIEESLDVMGMARSREFNGKSYRVWNEVESFAALDADPHAFIIDRQQGRISFAPAVQAYHADAPDRPEALAAIPPAGREIRAWYRCGGGQAGNVAPGRLSVMKKPIPGVVVTNPQAATGGREQESMANVMVRGPHELHSHSRAVTSRDYEHIASGTGGIARARAFTKAQIWRHAQPGTVQVLLVPEVGELPESQRLTVETLEFNQTEQSANLILQALDERRPLGTTVLVNWMRYKLVRVRARVTAFRGEDPDELQSRVCQRLCKIICPLPTQLQSTGWPFGQTMRVGRLYEEVLKEPGVKQVDQLRLVVDEVPSEKVVSLDADHFQPKTWHVISGSLVYRSTDNGQAWERLAALPEIEKGESFVRVRTHPGRAGCVAIMSKIPGERTSGRIYVSQDCGETWRAQFRTGYELHDFAWIIRDDQAAMLVAATNGLYEGGIGTGAQLRQLVVGNLPTDLGFWTVAVSTDFRGRPVNVAVAAEESKGVWVSYEAGRSKTFLPIGLKKEDIRILSVQYDGSRSLLWAGAAVVGNQPGKGCYRWGGPNEEWQQFQVGWRGGSCYGIVVCGRYVMAATYGGGVLRMDTRKKADDMRWNPLELNCGLPRRDEANPFAPVRGIAANPDGDKVMAGGDAGVYLSEDDGKNYGFVSNCEFADNVVLPETSLFCAGDHEITVVDEDHRS